MKHIFLELELREIFVGNECTGRGRSSWRLTELVCIYSHSPSSESMTDLCRISLEIHFIADDTGAFTGAAGLLFDASPMLGAPRSKVSARHWTSILSAPFEIPPFLNKLLIRISYAALRHRRRRRKSHHHRCRGEPTRRYRHWRRNDPRATLS